MSDPAAKPEQIRTCRWALALGIALLLASVAGAAVLIPRLAARGPLYAGEAPSRASR